VTQLIIQEEKDAAAIPATSDVAQMTVQPTLAPIKHKKVKRAVTRKAAIVDEVDDTTELPTPAGKQTPSARSSSR
jgi:hypothetical protein